MAAACTVIRRDRGMALIMAVLVVSLLTLIVVEFAYEMRVDAALANNSLLELEADYAVRSAVNTVKALLRNSMLDQMVVPAHARADTLLDEWAELNQIEVGDATVYMRVTDEDGKININRLVKPGVSPGLAPDAGLHVKVKQSLVHLYDQFGIDPALVDMLADWIDLDEVPRSELGSESDYYQSGILDVPYRSKNARIDSIDEMLLIHGYTRKLVFGTGGFPGLQAYLTAYGGMDGRINVNTAPEPVLNAVLGPENSYVAGRIASERRDQPFEGMSDLKRRLPIGADSSKLKTSSEVFMCDCLVEIRGYRKRVWCVIARKPYRSRVIFKTLMWKERA